MKTLIDDMSSLGPEDSSDELKELSTWYEGIVFLHDSYKKWDSLSFDDKENAFIEIVLIQDRRSNYKN